MKRATRERGAAELQTQAQAETLKTQEAVTGAEAGDGSNRSTQCPMWLARTGPMVLPIG